jgi:AcrR family transcriptional regulator
VPQGLSRSDATKLESEAAWDPKPQNTRDKLVEAARQLFLVKGYEATGVAEILREAGVNSGSLYYFFKTKEDLLLAVLDLYVEMLYPAVMDPVFSQVGDPIERVFSVLQGYRQMLIITSCRQGCPIGNLALEMSEKSEAAREKIALNFRNWRKAIEGCLRDAADRFPPGADFEGMSVFILTVMEGAVMQARAHRSLEPYDTSVKGLREYIDRMMVR